MSRLLTDPKEQSGGWYIAPGGSGRTTSSA